MVAAAPSSETQRLKHALAAGGGGGGYGSIPLAKDLEKGTCGGAGTAAISTWQSIAETAQLASLFAVWYVLNVLYNIDNKRALSLLPLPWMVSTYQLLFGWIFFVSAWLFGLRPIPRCYSKALFLRAVVPQGACHFLVHFGAVVSMSIGAVSFTHIVKAGEPVLTALLSAAFLHQYFSWQTYTALVPVVAGVALASLTELSFTWASFACAMISNLGSSSRAIFAKKVMADRAAVGENLTSPNMYALLTIVATLISLPLALLFEGGVVVSVWQQATRAETGVTSAAILLKMSESALWYYTYNEVAYLCLERVNQVTHAVANTLKRVVIIVASVFVFSTPVTLLGAAGSAVAILGTLLYSLSKSKYG
ncbi:phosphoenolpyruvate/phosphate translocator 3, chloroplastic [Cyclospora cayetanensis]|uniref:Phosphoenolpyruvate/phosphate translocator 3, chloroplastic n=1 Tax=Cyclospora cayetanensis TaxID=88456 RepID=A0A6P6RPS9_9EIME|nr:phosphoenolpyruvate/phosphate translocator 3, chloroplastic [Cyclospora cayetanensis]